MLRSTLKLIVRGLTKDLGFSFINLAGLGIGLAACLLILLYVTDELSYDRNYELGDRMYRLHMTATIGGQEGDYAITPFAALPAFKREIAAVESGTSVLEWDGQVQIDGESYEEDNIILADTAFFEILSQDFISGDPTTVLDEPGSVVLTETTARRLFESTDVVGTPLQIRDQEMTVTGVIRDPGPSHLSYDIVVSRMSWPSAQREAIDQRWYNIGQLSYVVLAPGSDPANLEQTMAEVYERLAGEDGRGYGIWYEFSLMPVGDIHLYSDRQGEYAPTGSIQYVRAFSSIALIILIIACVNFANLSTARSTMRAKEVGVRKVAGAQKGDLIQRYLMESLIMTLVGLGIALIIVLAALGWMNSVTGKELSFGMLINPYLIGGMVVLVVVCTLAAGVYPAFVLSAYRPINVLRGGATGGGKSYVRQGLVVTQFMISVVLIIGTLAITGQIDYMKNKPLGFDKEAVAYIRMDTANDRETFESFRQRLLQNSQITSASFASGVPGATGELRIFVPEGRDTTETFATTVARVDHDYLDTYGMKMAAGRFYSRSYASDTSDAFVINQTAARTYGWTDEEAIGKMLEFRQVRESPVVGVIEDYHFGPLTQDIDPLVLILSPQPFGILSLRFAGDVSVNAVSGITEAWKEYEPVRPLDMTFVADDMESRYGAQESAAELVSVFTLLAVFIAALGLFGLAAFTVQRRTKEIGIRKALGARTVQLAALVTSEFGILLLIANVLAWPIGYLVVNRFWLSQFPYRMDLGIGIFVLAALISFVVMIVATLYHSVSAATSNPVESLRSE